MESRVQLSAVLWTGDGGDNNWDNPANWSTNALPGSGDDVTIDIAANVEHSDAVTDSINRLTSTQPLTISGGSLSIASASSTSGPLNVMGGKVEVQSGTFSMQGGGTDSGGSFAIGAGAALDFAGSTAFSLDDATTFSGAGNLIKDGPTTLTLAGNSGSFTGTTTVNDGTLLVDGSLAASSVSVLSGATLGGSGTVGAVTTIGGTLQPGNALGILNIQGNVTLDGTSTIGVDLNGPTPGAGYDQLDVNGAINLNGSTLSPSLGFSPSSQVFTIIRSTAPINGTFQGLPEGHTLLIGGRLFTISYDSGGGDDVALTVVGPASPPQILTNAASMTFTVGTTGNFTIDAVGSPVPTWSYTGNLPAGVTFVDNGDGSATLAGKPQAGTGGTYQLVLTAANGVGTAPTEDFTLTVNEAPTFTSAAAASFVAGDSNSFTFTTSGFPAAALSESQSLPSGVHFLDNGDGTATLSGIPAAGTGGNHSLIITATNGQGSSVTQDFTLIVNESVGPASPPQIQPNAASMTFTVGTTGNFTIDAVGSPVPKWTYTGPLPAGVIFVDNGDGSATLAGKPQAGTGGTYPLVLTAANGVGTAPTEDFTLTVNEAPTFTNTVAATFSAEAAGSFLFTTAGFPTSALSESGPLPSGVTFVDNHNGTATLSGISSAGAAGTYHLTITATNNVGAGTTQPFTLTVNPSNNPTSSNPSPSSPTITSAGSTMFSTDSGNEFQVTASGTPSPTISLTGALPPGVTFVDNHNGTATLTGNPAMGSAGAYHLTITAANGVGAAVTEDFTLDVVIATPPAVVRLQRIGRGARRAQIVLSFNQPMALTAAELASNYVLRPVVRGRG